MTASVTARAITIVGDGDLTASPPDQPDWIPDRVGEKIERPGQKLSALKKRGKS